MPSTTPPRGFSATGQNQRRVDELTGEHRAVVEVYRDTQHQQTPYLYGFLSGPLYPAGVPRNDVAPKVDAAAETWALIRDSRNPEDFEDFAKAYPGSDYAPGARVRAAALRRVAAPSVPDPFFGGSRAPTPSAACGDYQSCRRAGSAAMPASRWQEALAYAEAAHAKDPERGGAWEDIGNAKLAMGRYDEVPAAWDKALRTDQPLGFNACHERGIKSCERGFLWLKPTEVFFMVGARKIFSGAPSEISVKKTEHAGGHVSLTLIIGGKDYQLDFVPWGVSCEFGVFVNCSADNSARQTVTGNYVAATIRKLASGRSGQN